MQIIILGAGQVGSSLAAHLVTEHSITVVDTGAQRLNELQSQYDLRTVQGHGSHPQTLTEAGADSADMIIAVTTDDETNIVACLAAGAVFKIPLKIARVRTGDYFNSAGRFFAGEHTPIDVFINPATLITRSIEQLMEYPGALRVFDFDRGRVKLVATKPLAGGDLLGKHAQDLQEYLPGAAAKIIAIYRNNQAMPLDATTITIGDDVLFVAANDQVIPVLNTLRPAAGARKHKRIMIIGGGYIGSQLARTLENHHQVKLIEQSQQRCEQLAQQLENTLILRGNGCDSHLLRDEDVENIDYFCALTHSDADNIVSALHSKQLGAKQVIALVNQDAYLSLIISGYVNIDIALSPQQITVSAILKYVRHGHITQAYTLRRGAAEALEMTVYRNAKISGCTPAQLSLPAGLQITAIVRNHAMIIVNENTEIQPDDQVIVFVSDKAQIPELERLFATKSNF